MGTSRGEYSQMLTNVILNAYGQGVCSDNVCFCRSPYFGIQCEKSAHEGNIQLTYSSVAAICCIAPLVGIGLAIALFNFILDKRKQYEVPGEKEFKKEVWRPSDNRNSSRR